MARTNQNLLLRNISRQIGKQIVVKRYGKKTVVTAYPDMSHIKPSKEQKKQRTIFKEAVAYAKEIINDPEKKSLYAIKAKRKRMTVYHYAMREYMESQK